MNCECTVLEREQFAELQTQLEITIETENKIQRLVKYLTDTKEFPWTCAPDMRSVADKVLEHMARLELIQSENHPLGGKVYLPPGTDEIFGRTDGVDVNLFR